MSAVLDPTAAPPPSPRPPKPETLGDVLHRLGDIPADRVLAVPPPGTATVADLIAANEAGPTCELIDGTLVEKPVGAHESWVTFILIGEFYMYLRRHNVGMGYAPDAVLQVLPGVGRAPDVSIVLWTSLPNRRPPARDDRVPAVVPDLAVEVLSHSNTKAEMARKRVIYFTAGVKRVWEIDPETRAAVVYTALDRAEPIPVDGALDGADILPGFCLSLRELFDQAEQMGVPE